jgi:hypothetical protein
LFSWALQVDIPSSAWVVFSAPIVIERIIYSIRMCSIDHAKLVQVVAKKIEKSCLSDARETSFLRYFHPELCKPRITVQISVRLARNKMVDV